MEFDRKWDGLLASGIGNDGYSLFLFRYVSKDEWVLAEISKRRKIFSMFWWIYLFNISFYIVLGHCFSKIFEIFKLKFFWIIYKRSKFWGKNW